MILNWLASLGLVSKLALGTGVVALGVAGTGAAGVLPAGAQETFDQVVSTVVVGQDADDAPETDATDDLVESELPADEDLEAPTHEDAEDAEDADDAEDAEATHGERVSAVAKDRTLTGREHGEAVSETARLQGSEAHAARDAAEEEPEAPEEPEAEADEAEDAEAEPAPAVKSSPSEKGQNKGNGRR